MRRVAERADAKKAGEKYTRRHRHQPRSHRSGLSFRPISRQAFQIKIHNE